MYVFNNSALVCSLIRVPDATFSVCLSSVQIEKDAHTVPL